MTSTPTSGQAAARRIAAFARPQDYSARTAYRPPAAYYRRINTPLGVLLTSVGLAPRDAVTLEVRGRTSGKLRRTPVLRTRCRGDDYLVSLAGESQWVRNVRAAGGRAVIRRRTAHPVHLVEVPAEERPEVIYAYLRRGVERSGSKSAAQQVRYYFGMNPDPSPEEIRQAAQFYPVFRIVADGGKLAEQRAQATSAAVPQVQAMTAQARDVHAPAAWPSQRAGHTRARLILIAPVAEVLTSPLVFGMLRRRYGERAGYLLGFVWYWLAWGLLFPLWAVGPRALAETLRAPRRRGPGRRAISLAALAGPPVGALAAAGLGSLGDADVTEIAISVAVAAVNSAAEELLWRGVFLARYPRSVIAGCLYPSVLFGASHLGPLSVRPSKRGSAAFVAAATALGYVYGLEARSGRSLRGTIASHLLTDAVGGLQTAAFLAGRETRQEDQ